MGIIFKGACLASCLLLGQKFGCSSFQGLQLGPCFFYEVIMELVYPFWAFFVLPALFLLAAIFWGVPVLAVISELMAMVSGKPFPKRCSQHLSRLAVWGHGCFWLVLFGGGILLGSKFWHQEFVQGYLLAVLLTLGIPMLGSLLLVAHDLSWKGAKARPLTHFGLGLLSCLSLKYGYWSLVVLALLYFRGIPLDAPAFIPPVQSSLWPLIGLWMPLSVCLGAALGLGYLVMRRGRDDWGRDYYRYAAPFLAKWHLLTGLGSCLVLGWLFWSVKSGFNMYLPQIFYPGMAGVACLVLGLVISAGLVLSENPMRMKASILALVMLSYLQSGFLLLALCETLTRYLPGWSVPTFVPAVLDLIL